MTADGHYRLRDYKLTASGLLVPRLCYKRTHPPVLTSGFSRRHRPAERWHPDQWCDSMDGGEVEDSCVVMEVWSSSGSEEEEEERTTSSLVDEMAAEERAYRHTVNNNNNKENSLCQEVSQGE